MHQIKRPLKTLVNVSYTSPSFHNILIEIENIDNKIKEIQLLLKDNKYLILSGAMFILYNDEITYLFSGSIYKYMKYNGIYKIIDDMIKYASDNEYKIFNFYGINEDYKNRKK